VSRFWLLVVLLISLGVNVGILATLGAQRLWQEPVVEAPPPPRPGPRPEQLRRLGQRLELEGEELARFVALHQDFLRSSRGHREKLHVLKGQLRRELAAPEPDIAAIEPVLEEMAAVYVELERALVSHVLVSREMLDGEAERRYLRFLSRMGAEQPRGARPGPRRGRPHRER
jgi:hypothetical protein